MTRHYIIRQHHSSFSSSLDLVERHLCILNFRVDVIGLFNMSQSILIMS